MRVGIIGISSNPSIAMFSHNGGWTYVLINQLKVRFNCDVDVVKDPELIHDYDILCINEGLNYKSGSWNFFGGMQSSSLLMIKNLIKYKNPVFCYNEKICWESLFKRKELRDSFYKLEDMPVVSLLSTEENSGNNIIIGDSHSVSVYEPGYNISRNDGATLYGSLKDGGLLDQVLVHNYEEVVLYFGNIDIRFHLMRQKNPQYALRQLCGEYNDFVCKLLQEGKKVTVQGLIPIESESRKIPGTGLYKGEPFYGTRRERQALVIAFNTQMADYANNFGYQYRGWNLPVDGFDEMDKFYCMESRQSVHLRPSYYMFKDKLI